MRDRGVYRQGKPEEIMTTELVSHVFDLECQMTTDPIFGTPLCIPYGKGRNIT
ncbi:putative siderophore transport system ATP-binding protein YusV [compost metagenome]